MSLSMLLLMSCPVLVRHFRAGQLPNAFEHNFQNSNCKTNSTIVAEGHHMIVFVYQTNTCCLSLLLSSKAVLLDHKL